MSRFSMSVFVQEGRLNVVAGGSGDLFNSLRARLVLIGGTQVSPVVDAVDLLACRFVLPHVVEAGTERAGLDDFMRSLFKSLTAEVV